MKNLSTILKIWKTEILTILKDPATILIMIIGLFMYSMFYAVPYSGELTRNVPVGVIDQDNTALSRKFIQSINSTEMIEVSSRPDTKNSAEQELFSDKIKAYIIVPKDFEKDVLSGKKTNVSLYSDSSYLLLYKQVANGTLTTSGYLSGALEIKKLRKKGLSEKQSTGIVKPFDYVEIPLYNPAGGYETYILPVVLVLIIQQTMLVGVGLLGGTKRERKREYCKNSNKPWVITIGNSLAYVSLYLLHATFFFVVIPHMYSYKSTLNLGLLFSVIVLFLFAVSFLAQALIFFFKERESSLMALVVTSLPMVFIPGFVWPKEAIPMWIRLLGNLIPATPGIDGIVRVNQMGANFFQIRHDIIHLIFLCVLYFVLACLSTKNICSKDEEKLH